MASKADSFQHLATFHFPGLPPLACSLWTGRDIVNVVLYRAPEVV